MLVYAFWALRGYTPDKLAALSSSEYLFLAAVREEWLKEVGECQAQ